MPTNPPQPPTATELAKLAAVHRFGSCDCVPSGDTVCGDCADATADALDQFAAALLASAAREQAASKAVHEYGKLHAQAESRLTALREALTALPRYRLRHFRDDDETALSCEMGVERSDVDDGVLIRVEDLRAALSASVPPQSEPHRCLSVPCPQCDPVEWENAAGAQPEASPATERPVTSGERERLHEIIASCNGLIDPEQHPWLSKQIDAALTPCDEAGHCVPLTEAAATPTPRCTCEGKEYCAIHGDPLTGQLRKPSSAPSSSREVESIRERRHDLYSSFQRGYRRRVAMLTDIDTLLRHLDAQEAELRGLIAQWRERAVQQRNLAGRSTARDAIALGGMADANEDRAADLDRLVTRREKGEKEGK